MGVSGGEEGALARAEHDAGRRRIGLRRIEPIVTKMAAHVDGEPCCAYIGPEGAGHYVKMVHNGIEYADMQLIAEAYDLFKSVYGLDAVGHRRDFRGMEQGRAQFLPHRDHGRRAAQARLDGQAARRRHSRRSRAKGNGTLDRAVGARSRRAADLDHRSRLRSRTVGPPGAADRRPANCFPDRP